MSDAGYFDDEWHDHVITEVTRQDEWYSLMFRDLDEEKGCMGIGLSVAECDDAGVIPKAGDALRLCGEFGRPNRGAVVNGVLIFYRTPEEEKERHRLMAEANQAKRRREFEETGRAELDAKYAALPPVFQARIDKFRHNNPDFRWEYEGYEMFCCTEAVKLANHMLATTSDRADAADSMRAYSGLSYEQQSAIDKAAGIDDGHSGNTHGAAVALAYWYLAQPENVERMHGALAPLVGSFAYGCVPPDEAL